mmetsp:Transcript_7890/g.23799  ORF Transcript_7890/g.23799 Transcript_7890/m.23799 type:complete len:294 (+) Transcript_7890:243-1124(+)|eukprot:CAMPEP_0198723914 /NCGR_PEP_ID=MMETSP1475-20131203/1417_1 /TAXON_ID= ORGANISM="Unidentified sp., Strain CCMP1999" /NCGR_SAMPLE_ID=MMETSP1475 /ASSEMBLY_ACC=CAM_ASM_001111 /LENGTH=293 /DNA_ID=CAMNT_0044485245 /DNA_START=211 /DNA_END=1092 /DNA_ORIENTATION=+
MKVIALFVIVGIFAGSATAFCYDDNVAITNEMPICDVDVLGLDTKAETCGCSWECASTDEVMKQAWYYHSQAEECSVRNTGIQVQQLYRCVKPSSYFTDNTMTCVHPTGTYICFSSKFLRAIMNDMSEQCYGSVRKPEIESAGILSCAFCHTTGTFRSMSKSQADTYASSRREIANPFINDVAERVQEEKKAVAQKVEAAKAAREANILDKAVSRQVEVCDSNCLSSHYTVENPQLPNNVCSAICVAQTCINGSLMEACVELTTDAGITDHNCHLGPTHAQCFCGFSPNPPCV